MCVIVTFPTRLYVDYMLRFTYEHSCLYLGIVNPWICQRVGPRRYKILVSQKYCGQKVLLSPTYRSTRRQGTAMRTRHSDANKAQRCQQGTAMPTRHSDANKAQRCQQGTAVPTRNSDANKAQRCQQGTAMPTRHSYTDCYQQVAPRSQTYAHGSYS